MVVYAVGLCKIYVNWGYLRNMGPLRTKIFEKICHPNQCDRCMAKTRENSNFVKHFCPSLMAIYLPKKSFTLDRQMRGDGHWTGQGLLLKCVLTLLNIGYFVIVRV